METPEAEPLNPETKVNKERIFYKVLNSSGPVPETSQEVFVYGSVSKIFGVGILLSVAKDLGINLSQVEFTISEDMNAELEQRGQNRITDQPIDFNEMLKYVLGVSANSFYATFIRTMLDKILVPLQSTISLDARTTSIENIPHLLELIKKPDARIVIDTAKNTPVLETLLGDTKVVLPDPNFSFRDSRAGSNVTSPNAGGVSYLGSAFRQLLEEHTEIEGAIRNNPIDFGFDITHTISNGDSSIDVWEKTGLSPIYQKPDDAQGDEEKFYVTLSSVATFGSKTVTCFIEYSFTLESNFEIKEILEKARKLKPDETILPDDVVDISDFESLTLEDGTFLTEDDCRKMSEFLSDIEGEMSIKFREHLKSELLLN